MAVILFNHISLSMTENITEDTKEKTIQTQELIPVNPPIESNHIPFANQTFNPFIGHSLLGSPLGIPSFDPESFAYVNPIPQVNIPGTSLVRGLEALPGAIPGVRPPENAAHRGPQDPKLENIVSTVNFDCKLDLRKIALHAKNAEYNPKRFAAVIMRIREPKTTALIFSSGKMVCTGAKSETDSETAARKYAKTIKKLGFDVKFKEFTIQNIVGSSSVNFPINLEVLQNQHQKFCTFDPEIFPGLIYRMVQPKIVLLIFCSGKVVLTGAKRREQLSEAFIKIYPTLSNCRKKDIIPPV